MFFPPPSRPDPEQTPAGGEPKNAATGNNAPGERLRLIDCPACGRAISSQAEACPQCGHPMRPTAPAPAGPTCYSCAAAATTRCQSCGALSCAQHLQSIFVSHGRGGAYELRCESCYSSAQAWKVFGCVIAAVVLVVMAVFFFKFFLPGWNNAGGRFP